MPKFNVFVDESKNLVSNYPDQFADILKAPDITKLTFRDVEKAFLAIDAFKNRKIVMMSMSHGSEFGTPPQYGQDTHLENDSNIYILTDRNDLKTTKKSLSPKDKSILGFLNIFIDILNSYMSTKKTMNSWSYLNREKYSKGIEEYVPVDLDFIKGLIEKYKDVYPRLQSKSSSSSPSQSPSSSTYSSSSDVPSKSSSDVPSKSSSDVPSKSSSSYSSSSASGGPPVSSPLIPSFLTEEEKELLIILVSDEEAFEDFKACLLPHIQFEEDIDPNTNCLQSFLTGKQKNVYEPLLEKLRRILIDNEGQWYELTTFPEFFDYLSVLKLAEGGKLKKTRRKSKRQRGRKTKMRKRR